MGSSLAVGMPERAVAGGVEIDLARGRVAIAGCEMHLRALPQAGHYWLDDGSTLRLPGFDERSRCVAAALRSQSPAASLLQALRELMLVAAPSSSATTSEALDGLLLALAGGALEAPPFRDCTMPGEDGDQSAMAVDLAAIERVGAASHSGGWQRLVFAPLDLAGLIDEMLQRLLDRGDFDEAVTDEVKAPASRPAQTISASTFARQKPASASARSQLTWPALNDGEVQGDATAAQSRTEPAQPLRHAPSSSAAMRIASMPLNPAGPRAASQASTSTNANAKQAPSPDVPEVPAVVGAEVHPFRLQAHATRTGATPRTPVQTTNPLRARWQLHRTPSAPTAAVALAVPVAREPEPHFGHSTERATHTPWPAAPTWANRPEEQSASHATTQPVAPPVMAHPDPLDQIARAMASECDLRGLAP
ncbi:hypothetical protein QTI66_01035 [Variovorax sp. J22R133]|uniref:hypothetical protein n=1 Tax=Variovorax brevis TaxID=3053503 RepID=UPI002578A782|nr:hypothetical protein [Variovorax sp. J22R133]MDM0110710.1 hypothetical protein [Variovorax sp. J22R133]